MAIGNHYTVTLTSDFSVLGELQNVFVYEQTAGSGNASTLAEAFQSDVLAAIVNIISGNTTYTQLDVINLDNTSDFHTMALTEVGAIAGEALPPFVTAAFEYVRADRAVQNGRKSFGVIAESSQSNGFATPDYVTACGLVATALESDVEDTATSSLWEPVIWRRPGTYASGVVTAPGEFYPINGVVFKRISTQNTRKIGRGS